ASGGHGRRRALAAGSGAAATLANRAGAGSNGDDAQGGQGMAETTADVRRDIALTRERMASTLDQLEQKLNVAEMVRQHPWPALALGGRRGAAQRLGRG